MQPRFVEVNFGSLTIKFYPLSIGQLMELDEEMKAMFAASQGANPFEPDRYRKLVKVWTASASRGDPNITEDRIKEVVDLGNIIQVNRAVLGQTGLLAPPGTEPSSDPTSPQIGGDSSPA
jgi:hypothetical protein